jgi:hypothetical protein
LKNYSSIFLLRDFIGCGPFVTIPTLDFNQLLNVQKSKIHIECESNVMAANDKYVLYCSKDYLHLFDISRMKMTKVKKDFLVQDICWSFFNDRFLILDNDKRVHLFNAQSRKYELSPFKTSSPIRTFTCYSQRLVFATTNTIEKYNMTELKFIKKVGYSNSIEKIRYSSNGNYLGVVKREDLPNKKHWFELLDSSSMEVLRKIDLGEISIGLLSLPDNQFLINRTGKKNFLVINPIDGSKKEASYAKRICSIALVGETKHLAIQTTKHIDVQRTKDQSLRLYNLSVNEQSE